MPIGCNSQKGSKGITDLLDLMRGGLHFLFHKDGLDTIEDSSIDMLSDPNKPVIYNACFPTHRSSATDSNQSIRNRTPPKAGLQPDSGDVVWLEDLLPGSNVKHNVLVSEAKMMFTVWSMVQPKSDGTSGLF